MNKLQIQRDIAALDQEIEDAPVDKKKVTYYVTKWA